MTVNFGLVLVTAASEAEAENLAKSLVENKLAACVSLSPIRSVYSWQGEIHSESEWQLLIKTNLAKFEALKTKIQELHSYEVPENYCYSHYRWQRGLSELARTIFRFVVRTLVLNY